MSSVATLTRPSMHRPVVQRPASSYTVVLPTHLSDARPSTQVYVRRRLLVTLLLATILAVVWLSAGSVLASRGGEPASAPAVRLATSAPAATYVVQAGDTMWSIASVHHGGVSLSAYVDALVELNGGVGLQIGQIVRLP